MKNRNEIPAEYKWDFSHIYETPAKWEEAYAECESMIPALEALKGTLGESSESLYNAFETLYEFYEKASRVGSYAFLAKALDGGDTNAQVMCDKVVMLEVKGSTATAFFDPELMEIPSDVLDGFMKYGPLKKYAHIIDDSTRLRDHILDEKSEGLLAKVGKIQGTPSDTYDMFTNVEMELPKIKDENGEVIELK